MTARRRFGSIRKRESGRYQARYRGPDGRMHGPDHTFARKSEAAAPKVSTSVVTRVALTK